MQEVWAPFLVGELRSHMHGTAKQKKKHPKLPSVQKFAFPNGGLSEAEVLLMVTWRLTRGVGKWPVSWSQLRTGLCWFAFSCCSRGSQCKNTEMVCHSLLQWTTGVGDGQGSLACCSPWGRRESDTTEWLNWTELADLGVDQATSGTGVQADVGMFRAETRGLFLFAGVGLINGGGAKADSTSQVSCWQESSCLSTFL